MKRLCYRGVFYDHTQHSIREAVERLSQNGASVQVLRYRGVFYLRLIESFNSRSTSTELMHHKTQLNLNIEEDSSSRSVMQNERIGYLYKLYCLGWRNGSMKCFPLLQHWLLSTFFNYRRGFVEGSQWKQDQLRGEHFKF